ncbi:MAG: hypothetical protein U0L92_08460, partial [Clostridia bacterium]|nr:hypothetical protein [Clostridia bacterium]
PLILCYIVAKAETQQADFCLAKNLLDYITILEFTQNRGHTHFTAVGLISIPDEKELLALMDEIRNEKSA